MSSFGMGFARVIIEVTREDGSIDRTTVHKVHMDSDDSSYFKVHTDDPYFLGGSPDVVLRTGHYEMDLLLTGQLLPADERGQLYLIETGVEP